MERSRSAGGGRESQDSSSVLSRRGYRIMSRGNIPNDGAVAYRLDGYDSNTNPSGIINLGTSENKISVDMMAKRLAQPDMFHIDPITLCYGDWKGHHFLKEEMARFLTDYCRAPAPLDPENVVVVNGCGSLFTALSAVLCDDGDGILIPTPYYGVIDNDLRDYSGVQTVHVPLYSKMESGETYPFQLTVPKLEAALTSAQDKEICVRGLILINPHNPLGDIYPADDLMSYLQFAKRHKLHVIMDEIYMLTIFKEGVEFTSVLSFDCLPDPSRTHVMWSLSKDFAASGLRIGVLYTCNSEVIQALGKIAYVHGVPGPLQSSVAQLLRDREWIDSEFLPTNRARLLAAHTYMAGRLRSMGVPYLDRASGLYIWANFQQFLKEPTFEAEVELWRALIQAKVLIGHGQAFLCPEPGWVRLVFSEKQQSLHLGMDRLEKALCNIKAKLSESVKVTSVKEIQVNAANNGVPHESFDSVETLIGQLQDQIQKSDWLSQNTAEDFALANPEVCVAFKKAAQE